MNKLWILLETNNSILFVDKESLSDSGTPVDDTKLIFKKYVGFLISNLKLFSEKVHFSSNEK